MTIEYLEEFCAAVRLQNITRAAESLFKSQSTLSRHLSELEAELDTRLIERDNRVFRLTPAGEYFYQETQNILADLERIRGRVRQLGDGCTGSLHMLSFCSYIPCVMEEVTRFRRDAPEILFSVDYRHKVIPSLLASEEADIGIGFDFEIPENGELAKLEIGTDDLCLIMPPEHQLAVCSSVQLSELYGENLLLFEDMSYELIDELAARFMHDGELRGNHLTKVGSLETMILRSRLGEGVGLLPRILAQERAAGCRLVGISDREFSFSLCLCWRPDNGNPALERFLSYFSAAQTKS